MASLETGSKRIVIAGASSLLGAELKSLLEESRFAASEFRLLDEELAAGLLTEAGGEPTVIQPVEEGSFARARFIFFTGSPEFTRANIAAARQSGATIIDLSGALTTDSSAILWFGALEGLRREEFAGKGSAYVIPSAAATAAAALSLGLTSIGLKSLMLVAFQPVSEAGRRGIEELESQTSQLLLMQSVGKPIFDTQVAFNMADRYGEASTQKLAATRQRLRAETKLCLGGKAAMPALQVVHAPVFYGASFAACATFDDGVKAEKISAACKSAGFSITEDSNAPTNVSAAGESVIQLAPPEEDSAQNGSWWLWGAADNVHFPAANAVKLADKLAI